MRRLAGIAAVALAVSSCGSGALSITEYAEETAALIHRVDARVDEAAVRLLGDPPTVEGMQEFLEIRVEGFDELLGELEALAPPERAAELHEWVVRLIGDQLDAESALSEAAGAVGSLEDLDAVLRGPEAGEVQRLEQESIALCHAAQQAMDDTQTGEAFEDIPWMPRDVAEVVSVSFGCPPA